MEKIKRAFHNCKAGDGNSQDADPLIETSMARSPLGILDRLPFEVRQLVYENVFCPSYLVIHSALSDLQEVLGSTLNILLVSPAVYEEAVVTLYRFSTFVFSYMNIFDAPEHQKTRLSEIRPEIFTHVEIRFDRVIYDRGTRLCDGGMSLEQSEQFFTDFCETPLGRLAFVEPCRKSLMTVTLRIDPAIMASEDFESMLHSWDEPFTPKLCALAGFRAVILEWHHCCECTKRREPPKTPMESPCKAVKQFQTSGDPLWEKLEKALGPGGVEDVSLWMREGPAHPHIPVCLYKYYSCHRRRWVFDPLAFGKGHDMGELDRLLTSRRRCAECNHSCDNLHPPRRG